MEGSRAAPFCRAPDGGRFLVDVTGPFLAKFGGILCPDIAMVTAIMDTDEGGPSLLAALGPPGSHDDAGGRSAMALETLAGVIGATAWPGQPCSEAGAGDLEVAAAEIVDGLSVEDVATQLPYAIASCGERQGTPKRRGIRRSGT